MEEINKESNKLESKHVSFSQFSTYLKCPHKFMLDYIKGLKQFEDSIHTCFGTAIHESFQTYIKTLYTESVEKADSIELYKFFKTVFDRELQRTNIKYTEDDYSEFCFDGEDIIKSFLVTATRIKHFPRDKFEFVDVELEMRMPVKNNVEFLAYIDLVLKEKITGNIKIIDFKTSTMGWRTEKDDFTKLSQLLLYKAFYSKKFNIPLNKINIEFFIVKRKLYENVNYPQTRIQIFIPKSNNAEIIETVNTFIGFLDDCFAKNGDFINDEKKYQKNPGERKKHCKYCSHKKIRCDQKQELV